MPVPPSGLVFMCKTENLGTNGQDAKARTRRGLCGDEPGPSAGAALVPSAHFRRPIRQRQRTGFCAHGIRAGRLRQGRSTGLSGFHPPPKFSLLRTLRVRTDRHDRNRRAPSGLSDVAPLQSIPLISERLNARCLPSVTADQPGMRKGLGWDAEVKLGWVRQKHEAVTGTSARAMA